MQTIEINSQRIKSVFYQRHLLTVELNTGQKFLYQTVAQETFDDFINANDKDKFYKTHIQFNDGFRRIQLFR
ncbi:KTSC domain-containing protein [Acinetobacter sp.]|uniref:KTSC domain-containing protein n=1 Tax=Acinetobacter sp. TaxID=472 RepID=UPI003CFC01B5